MSRSQATMATMVASTLQRHQDRPAIITEQGRHISFAELRERVWRLSSALVDGLGLRRGDRVGVLARNIPEYIEVDYAFALLGICKVPLYVRNSVSEHLEMMVDAEVCGLFCEGEFTGPLHAALGDWATLPKGVVAFSGQTVEAPGVLDYETLLAGGAARAPDPYLVQPDDAYHIRFTGGTTGRSKGALTDHTGMVVASVGNVYTHGYETAVGPGDVVGHVMGFSHVSSYMLAAYSHQGVAHLPIRHFDPERFLDLTERHGISISMLAPTMIAMLLEHPEEIAARDLGSLKTITYGGAPMPDVLLARALDAFGPIFVQVYGCSEVPSLVVWLPKRDHVGDPELLKSCGFAAPWIEMQILDDDCNVLPAGEVGEICLKSPSTMIGYVNRPEETAKALAGGWLHSGDIGLMDDRGYLYIKDRKTDMIISGGFNVYPKEVENALMRHPDVLECAVFGSADEVWGEAVSAVVQIRPGSTLDLREIQEHCKEHIGSYKKPRRVRVGIEPLPTSEHGKILRRVVREDFLAREFEGERR